MKRALLLLSEQQWGNLRGRLSLCLLQWRVMGLVGWLASVVNKYGEVIMVMIIEHRAKDG